MIKAGGRGPETEICKLVQEIWEKTPGSWNESLIYPIYKKGEILNVIIPYQ